MENRYNNYHDNANFIKNEKLFVQAGFIVDLIEQFRVLDNKKYEYFKSKYSDLYNEWFVADDPYLASAIKEIGEYLVNKSNNKIDGRKYYDALEVVFKECYGFNDRITYSEILRTMSRNIGRFKKYFPVMSKITDDKVEVIANENNKFKL